MPSRKSLERELLEAKLRAERAWERKKEDLAWKHRVFWPTVDAYETGEIEVDTQREIEAGD